MSDGKTTSDGISADTAGPDGAQAPVDVGACHFTIIHTDDGMCMLALTFENDSTGYSIALTREQRYDMGQMLLEPNGSGFHRTSGRADRFVMEALSRERREVAEKQKSE